MKIINTKLEVAYLIILICFSLLYVGLLWRKWNSISNWWNHRDSIQRISMCNTTLCSGTFFLIIYCLEVWVAFYFIRYLFICLLLLGKLYIDYSFFNFWKGEKVLVFSRFGSFFSVNNVPCGAYILSVFSLILNGYVFM